MNDSTGEQKSEILWWSLTSYKIFSNKLKVKKKKKTAMCKELWSESNVTGPKFSLIILLWVYFKNHKRNFCNPKMNHFTLQSFPKLVFLATC